MTLCIMIAKQRTGTGALGSILDQHPSISYHGEVFHHDAVDKPPNYFWFLRDLVKRNPELILPEANVRRFELYSRYLEERKARLRTFVDIKYSSLHHFNGHWLGILEPPTLFSILRSKAIPVVHLNRRNHLKSFISGQLAELNNEWHVRSADQITVHSLVIDTKTCLRFIRSKENEQARVRRILENHPRLLNLEYAELFAASGELREDSAAALAGFLEVEPFEKKMPVHIKQTSNDLTAVIENYDAVAKALAATNHAWMIERD